MTETVFALLASWGPWAVFALAFLSCLALPIPTSLMILTGGAFIAAGDLGPWGVILGAYGGAVLGEIVWVSLYVGLGYGFASRISTVAEGLGNLVGLAVALVVALAMALWIRAVLKAPTAEEKAGAA